MLRPIRGVRDLLREPLVRMKGGSQSKQEEPFNRDRGLTPVKEREKEGLGRKSLRLSCSSESHCPLEGPHIGQKESGSCLSLVASH